MVGDDENGEIDPTKGHCRQRWRILTKQSSSAEKIKESSVQEEERHSLYSSDEDGDGGLGAMA